MTSRFVVGRRASARTARWLAAFVLGSAVAACGGGGGSGASEERAAALAQPREPLGTVALRSDNAGCGYDALFVTVERVRVLQLDGAQHWIELVPAAPRRIDLLAASAGLLQALGMAPLAAGRYRQLRLVLGSGTSDGDMSNAIKPSGADLAALAVPSAVEGGVKLHGDILVPPGQTGDVVLQGFDPCEAVVQAGHPRSLRYQLKPAIGATMQLVTMAEMPIASGAVMPLMGGGYAIARRQPPNAWVLQRFGPDGQSAGAEVTVTAPADPTARIAPLTGGGYAAAWLELVQFERFGGSIYKVMMQSFAATGAPTGSPLQIAQSIPALYWIARPIAFPQVAALAGGGSVVVWAQSNGAGGLAMHARRFGADGTPAAAAQQVAPMGSGFLGVTALGTGGYLVTWGTFGAPDGGARAFGPDDAPLGPAQPAGPSWSDYPVDGGEPPVIAPLAGGGAVMVWLRDTFPYVRLQQLAGDAAPVGGTRTVDESSSAAPTHQAPAAAGLADGGYVVAWIEAGQVHARRFAANAAPAGEEARINLATTAAQPPVAVAAMADGGFMIAWSGEGADAIRKDYARLFPADGLLAVP